MAQKKIIIKGGIGNTERQNRDDMRVLGGGYHLHAEIPHRQGSSVSSQKSKAVAGEISNHQWGVVYFGYGVSPTIQARDYKYPALVIKVWKRK